MTKYHLTSYNNIEYLVTFSIETREVVIYRRDEYEQFKVSLTSRKPTIEDIEKQIVISGARGFLHSQTLLLSLLFDLEAEW